MTDPTHIFILVLAAATSVIGYFIIMYVHELKAVERYRDGITRHEQVIKQLNDNRALTLAAIQHRVALENDVSIIKKALAEIEERVEKLEEHCSDNSLGR